MLRNRKTAAGREGSDSIGQFFSSRTIIFWIGLTLSGLLWTIGPASGGCGQTQLCCRGKNNSCRAEGARVSNKDSFTCFCDAGCTDLSDCCFDYRDVCNPIDCVLSSSWSEWSNCDVLCGFGSRQRIRQVLVHPENNGKPCQPTTEKLVCEGSQCDDVSTKTRKSADRLEILRECGQIIPANFSRRLNDSRQLVSLRNETETFGQDFANYESENQEGFKQHERLAYCSRYELTESSFPCQELSFNRPSIRVPVLTKGLARGLKVCVECPALAMKSRLGGRCRGHGVHLSETRWNAVTIPGCHGKWVMTTRHRPCQCQSELEHSFVFL